MNAYARYGICKAKWRVRVARRLINTALVAPALSRGGQERAGASIFRDARNDTLMLRAVAVMICFSYALGRGREANAGRAHYAGLFPRRLHFT
jgi:hypothetical protein